MNKAQLVERMAQLSGFTKVDATELLMRLVKLLKKPC